MPQSTEHASFLVVDARVIDGANSTIIPGLIDAHAHVVSIADPVMFRGIRSTTSLRRATSRVWRADGALRR